MLYIDSIKHKISDDYSIKIWLIEESLIMLSSCMNLYLRFLWVWCVAVQVFCIDRKYQYALKALHALEQKEELYLD